MREIILSQTSSCQWLDQFEDADRVAAANLLALVKLVSGDVLRREFTKLLEDRLGSGETPVGLFNESERRMWRGKPNRLFKEKKELILRLRERRPREPTAKWARRSSQGSVVSMKRSEVKG